MQTENDTSKPEDSPEQQTGEGCPEATCYALLPGLIENLTLWAEEYKSKPVSLCLFRAAAILGEMNKSPEFKDHVFMHRTLKRVISERDSLQKLADELAAALSDLWHHYSLTEAGYEVVESALAMWEASKKDSQHNSVIK